MPAFATGSTTDELLGEPASQARGEQKGDEEQLLELGDNMGTSDTSTNAMSLLGASLLQPLLSATFLCSFLLLSVIEMICMFTCTFFLFWLLSLADALDEPQQGESKQTSETGAAAEVDLLSQGKVCGATFLPFSFSSSCFFFFFFKLIIEWGHWISSMETCASRAQGQGASASQADSNAGGVGGTRGVQKKAVDPKELLAQTAQPSPMVQSGVHSPPFVAHRDQNGLVVTMTCTKDPMDSTGAVSIVATYSNASPQALSNFLAQYAVPKEMQLELRQATGSMVPPNNSGSVTQSMRVVNPMSGQKPLSMLVKISYSCAGQPIEYQTKINNFPPGF